MSKLDDMTMKITVLRFGQLPTTVDKICCHTFAHETLPLWLQKICALVEKTLHKCNSSIEWISPSIVNRKQYLKLLYSSLNKGLL